MATRVLYETYDITSSLKAGNNIAAVSLGNGWYYQNDRSEDEPLSYDTPRFIAQLEMELLDGSVKVVKSDETWKSGGGPILHNGLYNGEIYDARLEQNGWNTSNFDDSQWKQAIAVRPPEGLAEAAVQSCQLRPAYRGGTVAHQAARRNPGILQERAPPLRDALDYEAREERERRAGEVSRGFGRGRSEAVGASAQTDKLPWRLGRPRLRWRPYLDQ